jgi:hypothetical protein
MPCRCQQVEATCAADDVMQIAVYGVDALEELSVTLLESISEGCWPVSAPTAQAVMPPHRWPARQAPWQQVATSSTKAST